MFYKATKVFDIESFHEIVTFYHYFQQLVKHLNHQHNVN